MRISLALFFFLATATLPGQDAASDQDAAASIWTKIRR